MESAKDATNVVKNTIYSIARKGDEKLFSAVNKPQEKVAGKEPEEAENAEKADKEPEKAENAEKPSELPNVADQNDTPITERAKSLVDSLGKLGTPTHQAPY